MKATITKETTICDRPGCGKRVTDKGGQMKLDATLYFVDGVPEGDGVRMDLCRECYETMKSAWTRKAEVEA